VFDSTYPTYTTNPTDELFDQINEALLKTTPEQQKAIIQFIKQLKAPSLNKVWRLSIVEKLHKTPEPEKRDILLMFLDVLIVAGRKIAKGSGSDD
jgi:protoheme ferro-lyase